MGETNQTIDGRREKRLGAALRRYGLLIAIVVVLVVLFTSRPHLLSSPQSLMNFSTTLLLQVSINGILAVGVTFVLLTGGVDVSLGA